MAKQTNFVQRCRGCGISYSCKSESWAQRKLREHLQQSRRCRAAYSYVELLDKIKLEG